MKTPTFLNKFLTKETEGIKEKFLWKKVFDITWPAYIDLFLAALLGLVDTIMVSRLGSYAIAAAGICNQPFNLFIAIFSAVNVGTTALVAWNVGAGSPQAAVSVARQTILINTVLGALLGVLGFITAPFIMMFMKADSSTFDYAVRFFQILSIGLLFQALTMGVTAALRGIGKTRPSMVYGVASNILNVFLNYTLIYGKLGFPKLGLDGSALATTIARFFACACAFWFLFSGRHIRISLKQNWRPDFTIIKKIFSIGIPSALEQVVIQSGLMVFSRTVNGLGVAAFAAHQIALTINGLAFATSQSFGVASTTLTGQSLGAKNPNLAEKYTSIALRLGNIASCTVGIVFILFGKHLASLFTQDAQVLAFIVPVFIIMAFVQPGQSTQLAIAGCLRGAGDTMYPLYASIFGIWIFRVAAAYIIVTLMHGGLVGAWIALLLDQSARALIVTLRFRTGKWKTIKDR